MAIAVTSKLEESLKNIGITNSKSIKYNPSYDDLYNDELNPDLTGYEKGRLTNFGAVAVDTGKYTGRSPKDKYIVEQPDSKDKIWWINDGADSKPMAPATWDHVKKLSLSQLKEKDLYVVDGFCGANPDTRLSVRLVCEVAWQAHFFKNMFIRPSDTDLEDFQPDWTILNASKTTCSDFDKLGMRSEAFAAFNLAERATCIGGSWYGGEMKKGIFSIMNYFLPLKGIGSFHCSANMGESGDTALFFGLSGTGKTTLSADPKRKLIGDDEHGWDDDGIFNFEGGCYAKTINLSKEKEPDIYNAIKRDALLENVGVDGEGNVVFSDNSKTENTRVSYPIYHINNIVKPVSKGTHPKNIVFLTCDAYGVLPPVSILDSEQAMYQFLSGYTAKVAGTEIGVTEPKATFSSGFGHPFLLLHPTVYADLLGQKMDKYGSKAYLVNTGWSGGAYGVGKRMDITATRAMIDAILSGEMESADCDILPIFNLSYPKSVSGVDATILNPKNTWIDKAAYDATAQKLAQLFIDNFKTFTNTAKGQDLVVAGPQL